MTSAEAHVKKFRKELHSGIAAMVLLALLERTVPGPYALQAAIAAIHSSKPDWGRVVSLYDQLLELQASPVIELNRAVAVAMRDGAEAGLRIIDGILARGDLGDYRFAHAARADLCRRLGLTEEARGAYERALKLTQQPGEQRFLEKRIRELN